MSVPNLLFIPQVSMCYQLWWHLTWHSKNGTNVTIARAQSSLQIDFLCDINRLGRIRMSHSFLFVCCFVFLFLDECTRKSLSDLFSEVRTSEPERRKGRWSKTIWDRIDRDSIQLSNVRVKRH